MPRKISLKSPRKNFGVIPDSYFIITMLGLVIVCILPLMFLAYRVIFTGYALVGPDYLNAGIRLILTAALAYPLWSDPRGFWQKSLRKRYVRKQLLPFLNKKYQVKIKDKQIDALLSGAPILKRADGEDIYCLGWRRIEEIAAGEVIDYNLGHDVHLVIRDEGQNALCEIPRVGATELFMLDLAPFQHQHEEVEPMTESKVRSIVLDIIDELPPGRVNFQIVSKSGGELPDVLKSMTVEVDKQNNVVYTKDSLNELVNAAFFNVQMTGDTMIMMIAKLAHTEQPYTAAILITKEYGWGDYMPEGANENIEEDDAIFLESISLLKNIKK